MKYFKGKILDFKIFNRLLSPKEKVEEESKMWCKWIATEIIYDCLTFVQKLLYRLGVRSLIRVVR